jgi:hypothetical protein
MTGDGTSGIYIWGAQLEYGTGATKYAPNPNKNLLISTENLTNYAPIDIYTPYPWRVSGANVASTSELDPNGNYTATNIVGVDTNPYVSQVISVKSNTTYTISVSAKGNNVPGLAIVSGNNLPYPNGSTQFCNFNFANPSGSGGSNFTKYTMSTENNGYTRCSMSIITDATQNQLLVMFWQGGYGYGYLSNTVTLFGPQLELGNSATPYTANTINLLSSKTLNGGGIEVTNEFDEVTWNPPIVTANLTLNLDAANPASYNGGNTWYDLSGRGNHGTFNGNVAVSSSNYGLMTFDGNYPTQINFNTSSGSSLGMIQSDFTVEAWVNGANTGLASLTGFPNYCILSLYGSSPTLGSNYGLNFMYGSILSSFYSSSVSSYPFQPTVNTWYHIVNTYNYTNKYANTYVNGTIVATGTYGTDLNANAAVAQVIVGGGAWGGGPWIGSIPVVRVYNKQLSQTEINQNYNALAYRYKL